MRLPGHSQLADADDTVAQGERQNRLVLEPARRFQGELCDAKLWLEDRKEH